VRPLYNVKLWFVIATVALTSTSAGCADSAEQEPVGEASEDALTAANGEFDAELRELEKLTAQCEQEGACASNGTLTPRSVGLAPQGLSFRRVKMCDVLRPFAAFENPYVFVGGSYKAAAIATLADGGVDLVFDLARRQMAVFRYKNHGVQNLVGAEANVYFGYAFGRKRNVLDAWSGEFQTAEATAETPFLKLSAGAAIFRAPDNSLWGALVEASIGVNALGPLSTVEVGVSEGHWTPWDRATEAMGHRLWLVSYETRRDHVGHATHSYVQFETARGTALALVQTMGPAGIGPAAHALALATLQQRGLTIARACGT
jgi:hypothetical protein